MSAQYNVAPGYVQVPAPTLAPPRVGLLASAEIITDPNLRWEGGYFYVPPLATGWSSNFPLEFCESNWGAISTCEPTTVQPFLSVVGEKTSTFNKSSKDLYSRTRETLLANEAWVVEYMFINGGGIDMPHLMNPTNIFDGATAGFESAIDAFAKIDQSANGGYTGERWMIFVGARTLAHLLRHQVVRRDGNIYRSPYDTIVVPMLSSLPTPPSEAAPSATEEYMYATSMVQIRRSELIVLPEPVAPTEGNPFGYPASAIDRSTNLITVSTQRIYGISFTAYGDGSGGPEVPVLYAGVDLTL